MDEIKVCAAYEIDGKRVSGFPNSAYVLENVKPVYETLSSWREDISRCRGFGDLPPEARDYIGYIERESGTGVGLIGVGPGREDTIYRDF
jgi:adenylosuccinate synthase